MKRFIVFIFVVEIFILLPSYVHADIFSNINFLKTAIGEEQSASVIVSVSDFSVRKFILDTKSKNVKLEGNNKGILTEVSNTGNYIKSWDIEYEKKGNSRDVCNPPVLNLKFDKKDKKNNPKPLFNGTTTLFGKNVLNYQKIRLIPDCEIWESTQFIASTGINVLLKEYFIYSLFRLFEIPTSDVIAFANITFNSSDTNFDKNKEYKYLILQRDNEPDDQIPFLSQYGLSELVEASDAGKTSNYQKSGDHFYSINYEENEIKRDLKLDPETTIKYFILSDFVNLNDHFLFWNEDYGKDKITGLWKIVPFDFDLSFDCGLPVVPTGLVKEIEKLSPEEKIKYKNLYYKISREIFDNPESLEKMLAIVDRFPFEGNKETLKNYVRVAFYNYALYFGLPEFSNYIGKSHISFVNEESYIKSVESIKIISTLNKYCDDSYKKRLNDSLSTYSKIKSVQLKSVETLNVLMTEVSPFFSITLIPSKASINDKVTLYWRGADTDIDSTIEIYSLSEKVTLQERSSDGFSLIFTVPASLNGGTYNVKVNNTRHGVSGTKQLIINPPIKVAPILFTKILTDAQILSVKGLLQAFGANQDVVNNVQNVLSGKVAPTPTPIYTPVYTPSPTYTPIYTPSPTYTPTVTATPTSTSTPTPTITSSPTPSPSPSSSPTSRIYFGSFVGNVLDGIKGLFR
ncbi:MAG: CotH kinase family protein [Patescibacteria group bacterium]|nr:CotH kinase family protein [Patescibacteria group bacterium]